MTPATEDALIRLGFMLTERILIPLLVRLIEGTQVQPADLYATARLIVNGIEKDWPGLSGERRAEMARAAIQQMINNHGGVAAVRDVNALLELAVQEVEV